MAEKNKITGQFAVRYRKAKKKNKTIILNEYLALVGGNRKYAIFKLNRDGKRQLRHIDGTYVNVEISSRKQKKRIYTPYYGEDVKAALVKLWKFFRYICGERLTPLIKENLTAICRYGRFGITAEIKKKLSQISRSPAEREFVGKPCSWQTIRVLH